MSARFLPTTTIVLVTLQALTVSVVAADAPSDRVATTLAEVDEDFAFQGEYYGDVRAVDGRRVMFGLQVVALGDGQFSALGYQGGLPGNGWDQENFISCHGARQADVLTLSGERGTVIIQQGNGRVIDAAGQEVGRVQKVRRTSITLGAAPPPNAVVLFDGTSVAKFEQGTLTQEGWLAPGAVTKLPVRDFRLHLEFQTPYMPYSREQARGNSGVYIQRRYEVQILDSFGLLPESNDCGALYRQQGPDLNMSFPPLAWQTYDIDFTAARWDAEGNKTADAIITVMHNGVPIHRRRAVTTKTGAGQPETAYDGPLLLQDHGNPVQFRNIWLVARDASSSPRPRPTTELRETAVCEPCGGGNGWWLWRGM
jgi:hypothetical protein